MSIEQYANRGKKGVRVYFLMSGTNSVYSDVVEKTRMNRLIFWGGNWNPTADCYLTAGQCRRAHGMQHNATVQKATEVVEKGIAQLEKLRDGLETLIVEPR